MAKKTSGNGTGSLTGTPGNDTFTVTSSTTSISGGSGTNTAIFSDDISRYTITSGTGGFNVTNVITGQVVYVANVQVLEFNGGSEVYYDTTNTFAPSSTGAVVGTAGNDVFNVASNWTSVNGGGGGDTAIFSADISTYTIGAASGGFNVRNVSTGQNVYVTNVQTLEFNGGSEVYYDTTNTFAPSSTGAVVGTAGNDVFNVASNWTSVNGGGGGDTAIFSADISTYTIGAASGGFNVRNVSTGQNVYVTNVQTLEFNGGSEVYYDTTNTFAPSSTGAVVGTAGNDVFNVASNWTSLNGGGGGDTAIFSADISTYTIGAASGGFNVRNMSTGQNVYVTNVQTLEFNGGSEVYSATGVTAQSAAGFLNSLGVNTHLGNWTVYENAGIVQNSLAYLGISNVRDGLRSTSDAWSEYNQLAKAGVRFDFLIRDDTNLSTFQSELDTFVKTNPGSLSAIEGPNEVDQQPYSYNGSSTLSSNALFQQALYQTVKADPLLAGTPVFNLTVVQPTSYTAIGDLSSAADYANVHAYVWDGSSPNGGLLNYISRGQIDAPGLPTVFSEAGYDTMTTDTMSGVDQTVQAKYTLDTLMDTFTDGVSRTYLYELLDEMSDPNYTNVYDHFGLFNNDGSPKLTATGIHNLTQILSDPNGSSSFTPGHLNYTLSGMPTTGNNLLLQKSVGSFDLVLWVEPKIWNPTLQQEIAAPTSQVTVNLGKTYSNVAVYDPLVGSAPIATSSNTQLAQLALTDHPIILSVSPT